MVEVSLALRTLFTGSIDQHDDTYRIGIPAEEVDHGTVVPGAIYHVALLERASTTQTAADTEAHIPSTPPVTDGERHTLTIEALGAKRDGVPKSGAAMW